MNRCGKAAHFRPKQGRGSSQRQRLVIVTGVVSFGESTRDRARPNRHQGLSVFAWPGWRGFSYGHEQGTRGDSRPQIIGRVPANHAAGPRSFIGDTLFFFSSYGPSPAVETSIKTNISRIAVEQRVAPLELVFLFFFFFFFFAGCQCYAPTQMPFTQHVPRLRRRSILQTEARCPKHHCTVK